MRAPTLAGAGRGRELELPVAASAHQNGRVPTVLQVVRTAIAPLTRTRLFRALGPVLLPPVERLLAWATDTDAIGNLLDGVLDHLLGQI